jgi:N6-adenosine-specific RNA methylase IME4
MSVAVRFHEAASIFPLVQGDEFNALVADIKACGQREPITLHPDGSILDGRNRYRSCLKIGIKPIFKTWKGKGSPLEFVLSLNLHRRQLSASQRAALAVDLLPRFEGEARERQRGGQGGRLLPVNLSEAKGESAEHAAAITKVSGAYVKRAKMLKDEWPELFRQVRAGTLGLNEAMEQVKVQRRETIRKENARLVRRTRPLPADIKYQTIVIDPPWDYEGAGYKNVRVLKPPYATMPLCEIAKLPLGDLAARDAHLYLWITNLFLPHGFELLNAWGFRYATMLTWVKAKKPMIASYFHATTEHVLFGVKGSLPLLRDGVATHFVADRAKGHSAKPDEFYSLVESCSPGPWIDLFARRARPGWASWGAEVGKAS